MTVGPTSRVFRRTRPLLGLTWWGLILFAALAPWFSPALFFWVALGAGYGTMLVLGHTVPLAFVGIRRVRRAVLAEPDGSGTSACPSALDLRHVLLIPNYREDKHMLASTLAHLARHEQASASYIVVLAMEGAEEGGEAKARDLERKFTDAFHRIVRTTHQLLPNESPGKSSNLRHAAREVHRLLVDQDGMSSEHLIITVLDSDNLVPETYFHTLMAKHSATPHRTATLYAPPISFHVNSASTSALVRLMDKLWMIGELGLLMSRQGLRLPCSVYSLSMCLARDVDFWDAGPEATSEDIHMALKCFFVTAGRLHVETIYSPVGCRHVTATGFPETVRQRYRQALRHMLGGISLAYALDRALAARRDLGLLRCTRAVLPLAAFHLAPLMLNWCCFCVPSVMLVLSAMGRPIPDGVAVAFAGFLCASLVYLVSLVTAAERMCQLLGTRSTARPRSRRFVLDVMWLVPVIVLHAMASLSAYTWLIFTDRPPGAGTVAPK